MAFKHNDCWNFATVDVNKGICRRLGQLILIDTDVCEHFNERPKCRNCACYAPGEEENLGVCRAEKEEHWTYP